MMYRAFHPLAGCAILLAVASCGETGEAPEQRSELQSIQRDYEWTDARWATAESPEKARVVSFWRDHAADMIEQRGATLVADEVMSQLTEEMVACVDRLVALLPEESRSTRIDVMGEDCAGYVADEHMRQEFERLRSANH